MDQFYWIAPKTVMFQILFPNIEKTRKGKILMKNNFFFRCYIFIIPGFNGGIKNYSPHAPKVICHSVMDSYWEELMGWLLVYLFLLLILKFTPAFHFIAYLLFLEPQLISVHSWSIHWHVRNSSWKDWLFHGILLMILMN